MDLIRNQFEFPIILILTLSLFIPNILSIEILSHSRQYELGIESKIHSFHILDQLVEETETNDTIAPYIGPQTTNLVFHLDINLPVFASGLNYNGSRYFKKLFILFRHLRL